MDWRRVDPVGVVLVVGMVVSLIPLLFVTAMGFVLGDYAIGVTGSLVLVLVLSLLYLFRKRVGSLVYFEE